MRTITMLAAALALAGCNREAEREVASGTVTDAATGKTTRYSVSKGEDDSVAIRTDDGSIRVTTGAGAAMPAGFPAYPGAEDGGSVASLSALGGASGREGGGMTSFLTADPPEKVMAFYRAAAEKLGYRIGAEANMGAMRMLAGERGDGGFQLIAQADQGSGKTSVTLMAGAKQ